MLRLYDTTTRRKAGFFMLARCVTYNVSAFKQTKERYEPRNLA